LSGHIVDVNGRKVWLLEDGDGPPLLYLHGFADVHSVKESWLPFHEQLAGNARVIAPAHPGCAQSDEDRDIDTVEDVVFSYLELFDSLKLTQFDLVGSCVGGWIAAELTVRHPEKIRKLVLIGATGLYVQGALIGDVFMNAQPEYGSSYATLREMLFSRSDHPMALDLFPDGKGELEDEVRRYQMLRLSSRIGFKPPYFYNHSLVNRLHRINSPTLVIWGEHDHMVPLKHGETYTERIPQAKLAIISATGHSTYLENPGEVAQMILKFVAR
jgi:pimeloyl-ACP methyl ester carboxylesterase